jgi:hypothetical protein
MTADLFQWLWNILRVHAVPLLLFVALALLIESPLIAFPTLRAKRIRVSISHISVPTSISTSCARTTLWPVKALGDPFLAVNKDMPDPTASQVERVLTAPVRLLGLANRDRV